MTNDIMTKEPKILSLRLIVKSEPYQLPHAELSHQEVNLRTPSGNSGDVYLSGSSLGCKDDNLRYAIPSGSAERISISNLDELWYYGTANDYLYLISEITTME